LQLTISIQKGIEHSHTSWQVFFKLNYLFSDKISSYTHQIFFLNIFRITIKISFLSTLETQIPNKKYKNMIFATYFNIKKSRWLYLLFLLLIFHNYY
jgi:hypothetical protein